jgi:VanZ family protein
VTPHLPDRHPNGESPQRMNARTTTILRVIGLICVGVIAVLSLVPVELRPHIGPKLLEHFGAYFATGLLLALAYPQLRWIIVAVLSVYAAALEIAQMWVPGRTAGIADFVSSSLGVCLGVVLVLVAHRLFSRPNIAARSRSGRG